VTFFKNGSISIKGMLILHNQDLSHGISPPVRLLVELQVVPAEAAPFCVIQVESSL